MQISSHLNKISWSIGDKATFALYGIATIAVLQVTDKIDIGLFTLFNNLHNFILAIASNIGCQVILHFAAKDADKALINTYAMFNIVVVIIFMLVLVLLFQHSLAELLDEPNIVVVAQSIPLLALISIPRYFSIYIFCRELQMFRLFIANLVYFGTMSGIIFYCVFADRFLIFTDLINITYLGSAFSAVIAVILSREYWRFSMRRTLSSVTYSEVLKYSAKYSIVGITISLPRTLDVYAIQLFLGTAVVGLYSPAKTIFRFVEDAVNTVYTMIYSPTVKCFARNDMVSLNQLISKIISLLFVGFTLLTLICWLGGTEIFTYFLPEKFISAIPFFNMLMISSIVLPFTLLNSTISASGKPELVAKYVFFSFLFWCLSFYVVGNFCNGYFPAIAIPNIIFNLVFSIFLFRYSSKQYDLKLKQLFRILPDAYYFAMKLINKKN